MLFNLSISWLKIAILLSYSPIFLLTFVNSWIFLVKVSFYWYEPLNLESYVFIYSVLDLRIELKLSYYFYWFAIFVSSARYFLKISSFYWLKDLILYSKSWLIFVLVTFDSLTPFLNSSFYWAALENFSSRVTIVVFR